MTIGLTYCGYADEQKFYEKWLKGSGKENIQIIMLAAHKNNAAAIATCDALVLSGGTDVYPSHYSSKKTNYPNHPKKFEQDRDDFEIQLFKTAQQQGLPVIGICRGLQLINCIMGGTLQQDLGAINNVHRDDPEAKAHGVQVIAGTLLHKITGMKRGVVNSYHHQAIKKMGKGLKVNCVADDGTIEGFERSDKNNKPFLLGVQWHPETMSVFGLEASPLSKSIRETFIGAVQQSIAKKK